MDITKLFANPKVRLAASTVVVALITGASTAAAAGTRQAWVGLIGGALYAGVKVLTPLGGSVGAFKQPE